MDLGLSWKHILREKDTAIVFYFYTTQYYNFFLFLQTLFIIKKEVCALHYPSAKRTTSERHAPSFSSRVPTCSWEYSFVSICVCSSLRVCVCMPVCRICHCDPVYDPVFASRNPTSPSFLLHRGSSCFEQSKCVSCPVSQTNYFLCRICCTRQGQGVFLRMWY